MNFNELSKKRVSCRAYDSTKEVLKADLIEILKLATYAPSACNSQPWKFIACDNEVAKKIPQLIIREDLKINHWTVDVPCFVVVCETKVTLMKSLNEASQQKYAQMDIGSAMTSLCLAACDKGISSCIIGVFDEPKLKELLCIPDDVVIRAVIALGYAKNDNTANKIRKPDEEAFSFNKW